MATATCTAFAGVLEGSGERVGQGVLFERVVFLAELSRELTGAVVASRWDEACLDVLAGGVDERGEALPSKGWMALRRLGWPQDLTECRLLLVRARLFLDQAPVSADASPAQVIRSGLAGVSVRVRPR
ncbi:hypothetical protein [Streptomyces sp. NPDC001315]|uniref:hypothetical protein n=1 Tax=Streptomyces sp. NPDC001315 TaxID=3364562 RepID=UPI00367DFD25